jgi:hypothetical protein
MRNGLVLTFAAALCACSPDDAPSGRGKLVGSYRLIVPANEATARKDFSGSALKLSSDGMFTQQCRYKNGRTESVIGTWSYSKRRARFSVFKDCAGVGPTTAVKRDVGASLIVEFSSPTTILLHPDVNVRYERVP